MKKLNVAIIGQGRSGRDIHGAYYKSDLNKYYNVKYVVERDEYRRNLAKEEYPGCQTLSNYTELFDKKDIDLVVNVSYSNEHYPITKDLLEHNFNVMTDKPFARSTYECETLIKTAKERGLVLMVFQQTFYSSYYTKTKEIMDSGILGKIEQISIRYNSLSRRWDWQTLQKKLGGNCYNTGPHPFGMALGFADFDKNLKVVFSRTGNTSMTAGDADDYVKAIITAPNRPVLDVEISNIDAYKNPNVRIQGTKGTYTTDISNYQMKYIVDGENVEREPIETFLENENRRPKYCSEKLITHEVEGVHDGTIMLNGTANLYEELYYKITEGKEVTITPENAMQIINVIEAIQAQNPLEVKF